MASFSYTRLFALVLCVLVAGSLSAKPLGPEVCPASCYYALLNAKFAATDEKSKAACTNPLRVKSTFYCIALHCKDEDVSPGIIWWATTCKQSKKAVNLAAYNTAISKVNDSYLESLPTVEYKPKKGKIVNGTVLPSDANWLVVHRTVKTYSDMREYADKVRWVQYGFWALVLLAGMAARLWSLLRRQSFASGNATKAKKIVSWFRFNIQLSPTFKRHHFEPYGLISIPLRLQSITILGYIVTHIALCAAHFPIYDESSYYSSRRAQSLRYLSDRLGTLMSSSLPFVFLFAARSNPFVYLTGWGYKVFNVFHRWIAIVLVVEGITHGVTFSAHYVNDKGWATYRDKLAHEEKFLYGLLMVISISVSAFLVFSGIRKRFYELFKATHLALAAIFLAAFYEHIKEQFKGVYRVWCWLCVGIWAADYVVRFIRIAVDNFKLFINKDTPAIASYSPDTGMIRLQVHRSAVTKQQTPGKYYFLYFGGLRFYEAHPFSLAGTSTPDAQQTPPLDFNHEKSATSAAITDRPVDSPFLTFMIRPRTGLTKSLRDSITRKAVSGQARLRVVLEGPYGTPANLDGFKNILFIAGGSGITAIIPYIRRIFEDGADGTITPNVKLIWTARHQGFVQDVFANDLSRSETSPNFTQEFYITSENAEPGIASDSGSGDEGSDDALADQRFLRQRLQVSLAVDGYLNEVQGPTAVFVCAPARMADEARVALIKHEKSNRNGQVRLFEEMYGW